MNRDKPTWHDGIIAREMEETSNYASCDPANIRMADALAYKAQSGEWPLTCPCAKENKIHPDCQDAEHCVRKSDQA